MSVYDLAVNSSIIIDHILTNPKKDPIFVNDATVTVTILDADFNPVPFPEGTWPVTMDYVLNSDGLYSCAINEIAAIEEERKYYVLIDVTGADGLKGQFRTEAKGVVIDV